MMDFDGLPNPAYVLDLPLLQKNLKLIKGVSRRAGVEFILAFKGFAMWSAFPFLNEEGFCKATASSLSEARLAVEEMGAQAHTFAPTYADEEIEELAALSSHISFNSWSQYERFAEKSKKVNEKISFGIRVNPEFSQVTVDLYNPCVPGSRLGIPLSAMPKNLPKNIEGFHFHALCESSSYELENLLAAVEEKFASYLPALKWLNMGGGHLLTRKDYNTEHLVSILTAFKKRHPHLHIILEPGSAFAWETGYLLCKVEDIVEYHGQKTALLNVSFAAHMPDCLEMPYQPTIMGASKEYQENCISYRIGGNSCLAGDVLGDWYFEKPLSVGDRIVFQDMIHYTMVKTTFFNGLKHPSIVIHKAGECLFRKDFGYEDYKNRLS